MHSEFRHLIREMPGKSRCDLTMLLAAGGDFRRLVEALAEPFRGSGVTKVAAIDAMGFALGGAVAALLEAGIVLIRKPGTVAWETEHVYFTDYTGQKKGFEVATDAASPQDRILIVDDWSETGAQLKAAIGLIERLGAEVVGAALVNVDSRTRNDPTLSRYTLHAVMEY